MQKIPQMKTPALIKKTNGSFMEAAIAEATGFPCIESAQEELKAYQTRRASRKEQREAMRAQKRERDRLRKLGAMWGGVWAWKELMAGRLTGDFREMPSGVLRAVCQTIGFDLGENPQDLPDALPFPVEELRANAGLLTQEEQATVAALYIGMAPARSGRNVADKPESWRSVPAVQIVDLRLLSRAEAKSRADKLADAIDKYLHRLPVSFAYSSEDTPGITSFVGEYVERVLAISPRLARSVTKLSQAFCAGAIKARAFQDYIAGIPVMPPDELRFLFRKQILWVSHYEES